MDDSILHHPIFESFLSKFSSIVTYYYRGEAIASDYLSSERIPYCQGLFRGYGHCLGPSREMVDAGEEVLPTPLVLRKRTN